MPHKKQGGTLLCNSHSPFVNIILATKYKFTQTTQLPKHILAALEISFACASKMPKGNICKRIYKILIHIKKIGPVIKAKGIWYYI